MKNPIFRNFVLSVILSLTCIASCFALAACTKKPEEPNDPEHIHSYTEALISPDTFHKSGVVSFTCNCGDSYNAPKTPGDVLIRDFSNQEYAESYGLQISTGDIQCGSSIIWKPFEDSLYIEEPYVTDCSAVSEFTFWAKNNGEKPITVTLYAISDALGTKDTDGYGAHLTLLSGWYKYTVPVSSMYTTGTPNGWDSIEYWCITSSDKSVTADLTVYVDSLYANESKNGEYLPIKYPITQNAVIFNEGSNTCLFNQMKGVRNFMAKADGVTMYVPISVLAEHRGAENIQSSSSSVSFKYNGTDYTFTKDQSFDFEGVSTGNNAGKALSAKAITSGDYLLIPMESAAQILGYKLFYDKMGLAIFSDNTVTYSPDDEYKILLNGGNATSIFSIIEQLAYVNYTGGEIIDLMNSRFPNDQHGRLMVTTEQFNTLKEVLKTDATLQNWVARLEKGYGKDSSKFKATPTVFTLSDGRRLLNASRDVMNKIMSWATLYKLTDDTEYAERIWLEVEAVCNFTDPLTGAKSWHPEHFLDTAEIMYPFAIAYDWLYDYWTDDRRETMENAVMEMGYGAAMGFGGVAEWWRNPDNYKDAVSKGYNGFKYNAPYAYSGPENDYSYYYYSAPWTNNWNGVCNGGMTAMCLAFANVNDQFREYSEHILSCIYYTVQPGLTEGYAPDGGYPESPGYWAYGTTYLAIMFSCLQSACGTDFGFTNAPGFSESFYFVSYLATTNNNGSWNYHDSGTGLDTTIYMWYARSSGDKNIATMRKQTLDNNTSITVWDVIFYDPNGFNESTITLNLDAYYYGIDTVTFRSSWEKNALFCGIHGGANAAPHGNLDIGNFIIELDGVRFICDLGSDDYNLTGFGSNSVKYFTNPYRYWFYRERAEGQNTLVINPAKVNTSITGSNDSNQGKNFDQLLGANAQILAYESGETGAYAVVDMGCAYIEVASGSIRGMLVTDDRSTVIVQDEIKFNYGSHELYSFMHVKSGAKVEILNDGRSAKVTYQKKTMLVTLVTDGDKNGNLTFGVMNAEYLPETERTPIPNEKAGSGYKKLYIHTTGCQEYRVAMVFQILDDDIYEYTWTDIENWKAE